MSTQDVPSSDAKLEITLVEGSSYVSANAMKPKPMACHIHMGNYVFVGLGISSRCGVTF